MDTSPNRTDTSSSRPSTAGAADVQYADANGLTFAYETFGSRADPAVLLVMGLGTQMLGWPDELCHHLASTGHFVVRFDNRDVGLSTHLDGTPAPGVGALLTHRAAAPYTVDDMATDAAGLLKALGLPPAHVVGASMGGFIAQTMAIRHPGRVRSLTLIMTSTGSHLVGNPKLAVAARLLRTEAAPGRDAIIDSLVSTFRLIGSRGYAFDEVYLRDVAERSFERSFDPVGYTRQLAACVAQPNRTRQLRGLAVPTVVIHGLADPLVNPSGGLALARAIPGANFVGLAGMGHDLPRPLWPRFASEIREVVQRAGGT